MTWFVPPDVAPAPAAHAPLEYAQVRNYALSWSHPGGQAVTYRICFTSPAIACGQAGSAIVNAATNLTHRITPEHALRYGYDRFAGAPRTRWTAAACNPAGCTWSTRYGELKIPPKAKAAVSGQWQYTRYDGSNRILIERGPGWGSLVVRDANWPVGGVPGATGAPPYAGSFRRCLIFEGDPALPNAHVPSSVEMCEQPLKSLLSTHVYGEQHPYPSSQCLLSGFLKRGLYRFYGATCSDFWGTCDWTRDGLQVGVTTSEYNSRDLSAGCYPPLTP